MHVSPNDNKHYRYITLANALRVLLINDPHAHRSAAALSVNVGHFHDPKDRQGLAHFLEHMLFLGTKPYPVLGDFQRFISQHGGHNNAWTGTENTTFFFDIRPNQFEPALDRFSAFFISPRFDADAVDKERQSVDAEYRMKLNDDVRRIYQVHKETINPHHPFAKFSVGSVDTLADRGDQRIRDDLIAFYHDNYSANLMTLALTGPQSLDTLEALAQQHFTAIPNQNYSILSIDEPLVTKAEQHQWVTIEPLKEVRKLTLAFSVPEHPTQYRTKPLSYIAHLLGYEGPGSLMSLLKNKGYINTLSAGGGISGRDFREFTLGFALTELGLSHIDDIITHVFQAMALIRRDGIQAWRYQEKRQVQELAFHYQDALRPIDTVSQAVMNMHHYAPDDVLYGDYMMTEFDQNQIQTMLQHMTVDNVRVMLVAKGFSYDHQANWYQTPYSVKRFSAQQIAKWKTDYTSPALTLPDPNPYIADALHPLAVEPGSGDAPSLVEELPGFRLWHGQEPHFCVPKGHIYIAIDSPHAVATVKNIVMTRLSVEMLLEALNEQAYQAEIAGINYNLYAHQGGVTLTLSGFNDKQPLLLELILQAFSRRSFNPERFDTIKAQLKRSWENAEKNKPLSQLYNSMTGLLQPNNPPYHALLSALDTVSLGDLPRFVDAMLATLHVDMFVYGNWHRHHAQALAETVKDTLRVKGQAYQESVRPLTLLDGVGTVSFERELGHAESALLVYYQSASTEPEAVATYTLANHLMSATFFNELRTKQQLGYMVGANNLPLNRHPGLIFYVQSPMAGPELLMGAIDDFLNAFFMVLLEMTDARWQSSKQSLLAQVREPDNNLRARAQRYWISIGNKDYQYQRREQVADAMASLTRADMVRFVVNTLKPRTADRLVMHSCGTEHQEDAELDGTYPIMDIDAFRARCGRSEE
ncbi:insulinase family protein [Salinivibrio sp. ES.052]|uniref:insulinase family protein n=1 Tax=Salinivibrio sp. ES.052 TaxID=1882823 RepID=UPI00092987E0|nr:insulinase family protein [Salinivibrio sp. ES.052]SIN76220.1 Secreted Zn-dependent peptidases, insulinase-like [Salinivibrio sp. ES.052]